MRRIFKTVDDHLTECTTLEKGCWVHLQNPTREEIDGLNTRFALDPTYLAAALDEEESARIEHEGDQDAHHRGHPLCGERRQRLYLQHHPSGHRAGGRHHYHRMHPGIRPSSPTFTQERVRNFWTFKRTRFILQLLHRNASRFLAYLKQIDKSSMHVQEKLEKSSRNQELLQMMKLEKSLVFFSTSLKGNELVMEKLLRQDSVPQALPRGYGPIGGRHHREQAGYGDVRHLPGHHERHHGRLRQHHQQ